MRGVPIDPPELELDSQSGQDVGVNPAVIKQGDEFIGASTEDVSERAVVGICEKCVSANSPGEIKRIG